MISLSFVPGLSKATDSSIYFTYDCQNSKMINMALHTTRSLFKRPLSSLFQILLINEINQHNSFEIPVCSKYHILVSDIGRLEDYDNYRDFLRNQTSKFEVVFLGLGIHEFYETTLNLGLEKAKQLGNEPCMDDPLILLHQRRYEIPFSRVIIIGCTLWPPIPPESTDIVHYKISDFQKIRGWSVEQHNKVHESDLAWLRGEIQTLRKTSQEKRSILVVTHHAPSLQRTSGPQHA